MKRFPILFLTYAAALTGAGPASAQTSFKIEAGALNSWTSIKDEDVYGELSTGQSFNRQGNFSSRIGFFGGFVIERKLSPTFAVRFSPKYLQTGWKEEYSISDIQTGPVVPSGEQYKETLRFNYLSLPVSFVFMAPLGRSLINFGTGGYISFPISGRMKKTSDNASDSDSTYFIDFSNKYNTCNCPKGNSPDLGINLHLGISGRSGWSVEAIYSIGMKDVLKDLYFILPNRNRYLALSVSTKLFEK